MFTEYQLTAEMRRGNIFLCTACVAENTYDPDGLKLPSPEVSKRGGIISQALDHFHFGRGRSGSLLDGAIFHLAKNESALSLFMMHQAAEQLLRGLLLSLALQNMRSHSLHELNNKMRKFIPALVLFEDAEDDDKRLLDQLEYSYSAARYNVSFDVSEHNLWSILRKLKRFRDAAVSTFNETISRFKIAYPINE